MSLIISIFRYQLKRKGTNMKGIDFDYIVVFCDKKTSQRNIAVYHGTFDQVYKLAKSLLSRKNYILDIKRA